MTKQEFKSLKVGDKVKIIAESPKPWVCNQWNECMEEYVGKTVTVERGPLSDSSVGIYVRIKEDGCAWHWYPHHIEKKIVTYKDKLKEEHPDRINPLSWGGCEACPGTYYDGAPRSVDCPHANRADCEKCWNSEFKDFTCTEKAPEVKEVKRPAKVGEWIKIIDAKETHGTYEDGDILKVYKLTVLGVYCEMKRKTFWGNNDNGNLYIGESEYVVLENYKPMAEDDAAQRRIAELEEMVKDLREQYAKSREECDMLHEENKNLTEENEELEKENDCLVKCCQDCGEQYDELKGENEELEKENKRLKDEAGTFVVELDLIKSQLKAAGIPLNAVLNGKAERVMNYACYYCASNREDLKKDIIEKAKKILNNTQFIVKFDNFRRKTGLNRVNESVHDAYTNYRDRCIARLDKLLED